MVTTFNAFKRLNETYQEEAGSSFTHDSSLYDLNKLLVLAEQLPVEMLPTAELAWVLQHDAPDPIRVNKADYTVPLLVTRWQGHSVTVDGLHRLAKAVRENIAKVPAKIVPASMLGQCLVGNRPDKMEDIVM